MHKAILVTGGAGFIGSNYVLNWLSRESAKIVNLDLLTYAGLPIDAKQLQRLVSLMAPVMNRWRGAQQPSPPDRAATFPARRSWSSSDLSAAQSLGKSAQKTCALR